MGKPRVSGAFRWRACRPETRELADFLVFCRQERQLSAATSDAYERDVRAFLGFAARGGIASLAAVRTPDLRAFLAAEAERRPAPGSRALTVAALKQRPLEGRARHVLGVEPVGDIGVAATITARGKVMIYRNFSVAALSQAFPITAAR